MKQLALFLLFFSTHTFAQKEGVPDTLFYSQDQPVIDIGQFARFHIDTEDSLTLAQVRALPDAAFLRSGKAAVEDFFSKLMQHLNMTQFEVDEYVAKGKKVVANGHCSGTARATGKSFASDFSATWRVNKKGKVNEYQLYLDTYNIAQAMGLAG